MASDTETYPKKNPARVLQALGEAAMKLPELRVGQLIDNVVTQRRCDCERPCGNCDDAANDLSALFYMDDDKLAEAIERYVTKHGGA